MKAEEIYPYYIKSYNVTTDTRKIEKNCIFFALKGANFNGNTFAQEAIKQGALAAIVDEVEFADKSKNIFLVDDVLKSLQNLAKFHRQKMNIPIVGLTGSNGKTTTKELIACVLQQKFNTLFTFGNLNNHIGVPLTLLKIKPEHQIAVIEMGANHQKEIELLASIAQPNIGYITNFGKAHLEGFVGFEGVIKGKSELYQYLKTNNQIALINNNDALQIEKSEGIQKITFGTADADYLIDLEISSTEFVSVKINNTDIKTQLIGQYNFPNVSAAIALGLHFEIPLEKIKLGIENYMPNNNRSQFIEKNGYKIVMDAYNANPSSMEVALKNFVQFGGFKTVILGDMFELGESAHEEHKNVLAQAIALKFDCIIAIGSNFATLDLKAPQLQIFENKDLFIQELSNRKIPKGHLLIKGSRGMALENILNVL